MKRIIPVIILALTVLAVSGCGGSAASGENGPLPVTLLVTRDFGSITLLEQQVITDEDSTALEVTDGSCDISLAGSYVEGIDGLYADADNYWFFYMNGIMSQQFASSYCLYPDDVIQWDFHDYSYSMNSSNATIGLFPEPFLNGYAGQIVPLTIACETSLLAQGEQIQSRLLEYGVENITVEAVENLTEEDLGRGSLILVCTGDNRLLEELVQKHERLGLYAWFRDGELVTVDADGENEQVYSSEAGLIEATLNIWNPEGSYASGTVLWLVAGTEEPDVVQSVDVLLNRFDELEHSFAVLIKDDEIKKLPFDGSDG